MNESSRRWNRWAWPVLSLALFALSVSSRWFQAAVAADRQGCVNVHGLEYATIVQAGMIFGLAVGPAIIRWARQAARVLMPEADATRRQQRINAVAALSIVLGMLTDIFWVVPQFNVYIDLHRPSWRKPTWYSTAWDFSPGPVGRFYWNGKLGSGGLFRWPWP